MWYVVYFCCFIVPFLLSLILVPVARKFAISHSILDQPDDRKIHLKPKPLLGGVAICIAFIGTVLINLLILFFCSEIFSLTHLMPDFLLSEIVSIKAVLPKLVVILFSGILILGLGLVDDIYKLSAKTKLMAQIMVALLLISFGIRITLFIENNFISSIITLIWIVGITNAFNLLDNMDGLSAGVAFIASIIFFAITALQGQVFTATILSAFAGSILGFLRYNMHPARIFMGDAGSMFIGYILAVLAVVSSYYTKSSPTLFPVIMPVLILGVPIFDTIFVLAVRIKNGKPVSEGDKNHFSHRLVNLGMTQKQAVWFIYLVTFCVGINALLLCFANIWGAGVLLVQTVCIFIIIVILERIAKRNNDKKSESS
ncbi:MAG: MraY family glycosyltransferase [bacterium]|nr:MraY family glycosyltransferase [bacterium]